jgi:hypothetical protein
MDRIGSVAERNGEAVRVTPTDRRRRGSKPAAERATRRVLSARRRIALAVGGVGAFVLALSVSHCTDTLVATTGAPWVLAGLLAVGIDCGMVACEVAATVAGRSARRWAKGYVALAVLLSMLLNALASAQHVAADYAVLAYAVGAVVPCWSSSLARWPASSGRKGKTAAPERIAPAVAGRRGACPTYSELGAS